MAFQNIFRDETEFETYQDGDWIFVEGQPGDVMYVVKAGSVDIFYDDKILDSVPPGGIVGEMALIGKNIRSTNAVAKGTCELVPINEQRFNDLIQNTPGFAVGVMKIMADRLRRQTG